MLYKRQTRGEPRALMGIPEIRARVAARHSQLPSLRTLRSEVVDIHANSAAADQKSQIGVLPRCYGTELTTKLPQHRPAAIARYPVGTTRVRQIGAIELPPIEANLDGLPAITYQ